MRRITRRPFFLPTKTSWFLPREHGSWSLALEPLGLGLLIAPSVPGGALALAAFTGFLARRPLKTALAPGLSESRAAARHTVVMLSVLAGAALVITVLLAGGRALWPLGFAAPLGGLFVWFDTRQQSRAAAAELTGSGAFACLPAALATIAGWSPAAALALAMIALARSAPTVLTVRTYLRQTKGRCVSPLRPFFAAGLAVVTLAALHHFGLVPTGAVVAATGLLGRSLWLLGSQRPAWSARRVGLFEAILGGLYVGSIALAYGAV